MTEEELSKMISEFLPYPAKGQHYALKQFASLVAAAEREACARVVEQAGVDGYGTLAAALLVRERGAP
jgi:hypothetical protein